MNLLQWIIAGWLGWRYDCIGAIVVFLTTLFAVFRGVSDGFTAVVIVQAGIFAEASRQLVKFVFYFSEIFPMLILFLAEKGPCST